MKTGTIIITLLILLGSQFATAATNDTIREKWQNISIENKKSIKSCCKNDKKESKEESKDNKPNELEKIPDMSEIENENWSRIILNGEIWQKQCVNKKENLVKCCKDKENECKDAAQNKKQRKACKKEGKNCRTKTH